jgi:hypothetical protein
LQVNQSACNARFGGIKPALQSPRWREECSGGEQFHYVISSGGVHAKVHEIELLSVLDFDVAAFRKKIKEMEDAQPDSL